MKRLPGFILQLRNYSALRTHALPGKRIPHAKYGGRHTITILPGDGIGPEMMTHLKKIFLAAHVPVDFEVIDASSKDPSNEALENVITAIQRNGGNIETKFDDPQFKSRNVEIRRRLDLFANVLHCVSIPNVPARHKDLDIVLIRENTEGEYSGLEHESIPGIIECIKIVTRRNIERVARYAFEYAVINNRSKANIQKLGDGLFLKTCEDLAKNEFKGVKLESMIVDNASMQLVSRPQQFNGGILLSGNLYGNVISNIACGLVGGPGLVSGMNIGDKTCIISGHAKHRHDLAGKDVANPTAFIRAGIDTLRYLELHDYADKLSDALFKALTEQRIHTQDIGGENRSSELVQAVIDNVKQTY
ncbi:Protein IDHG-2 [Aphelenchoides avenae]|nr:Protein IDHG-2 [Aphelenchus avenae]